MTERRKEDGPMEEVLYRSTRGKGEPVKASWAILKGLSEDGGLFVPDHIPALDKSLKELSEMDYGNVAYEVMKLWFAALMLHKI